MSFEKVNPSHPDKVADRIAGALVDLAYKKQDRPKIAVEVLIGHSECYIITETSVGLEYYEVSGIVDRIVGDTAAVLTHYIEVPQDSHLADNQADGVKCGDNGIFKGVPVNDEEKHLSKIVRELYKKWPTDGKFIYSKDDDLFIACQSNAKGDELVSYLTLKTGAAKDIIVNPLGEWTGGVNVDTGATNRKLGSDMGRAVTGGGLHGKDLSKADVAVNIACHILAQQTGKTIEALCAIGDDHINFKRSDGAEQKMPYGDVVKMASYYIENLGGFEKLAEWGLV
jgi:S-adenosylmethionine synthetase